MKKLLILVSSLLLVAGLQADIIQGDFANKPKLNSVNIAKLETDDILGVWWPGDFMAGCNLSTCSITGHGIEKRLECGCAGNPSRSSILLQRAKDCFITTADGVLACSPTNKQAYLDPRDTYYKYN